MENVQRLLVPIKKDSLVDQIHDGILELIIQGEVPDESVLTEGGLVQQFGVSKTTIREALVRLCNERVLKSIPRYGYMLVRMSEKENADIVRFRMLLEIGALREVFTRLTEADAQSIHQMLEQHQQNATNKVWDVWQKNIEFHCLLISFSRNPVFVEYLQRAMQSQAIYFGRSRWSEQRSFEDHISQEPHMGIYHSLCQKDEEQAVAYLMRDICWSRD